MKTTWFYFCLAVGLMLAWLATTPPEPLDDTAPLQAFSAGRAQTDVEAIAQAPHPLGSADHERVKAYLLARLTRLGLKPTLDVGIGVSQRWQDFARAAPVANIVARLPGRDPKLPALAVMCHYDSAPLSPGAADDGAGVASALEIARALKAGPQPARDVVFLFTDGEEGGLLGAEAFARHPLARHIGAVVNLEARGGDGLTAMFETGAGNDGLIARFAAVAERPTATSLADALYSRMPNGTDFSVPKDRGLTGLNFAFIGNEEAYHTPYATADHLNLGSVQHMGDQVLPIVRDLAGASELPARGGTAVYGDLFGWGLIHYPPLLGWLPLALAAVLVLFVFGAGRASDGGAVARAVFATGLMALLAALLLWPAGRWLGQMHHFQRVPLAPLVLGGCLLVAVSVLTLVARSLRSGRGAGLLALLAVAAAAAANVLGFDGVALALAGVCLVLILIVAGRPLDVADLWRGALIFGLLFGGAVQAFAPAFAPAVVWPLMLAVLAAAIAFGTGSGRPERLSAQIFCGLVAMAAVALVGCQARFLFDGVGIDLPAIAAAPLLVALPVLAPVLAASGSERSATEAGVLLLFAGIVVFCAARLCGPFEARPAPTIVQHVQDAKATKAFRVAPFPLLDPWAHAALEAGGGPILHGVLPLFGERTVWYAATKPARLTPPALTIERTGKRLVVIARGGAGTATLEISLKTSVPLAQSYLEGQPLHGTVAAGTWTRVVFLASDAGAVRWSFALPAHARIEAKAAAVAPVWAGAALPPMEPRFMPFADCGSTRQVATAAAAW